MGEVVRENRISHLIGSRGRETFTAKMGERMRAECAKAGQKNSALERAEPGRTSVKDLLADYSPP